MINVVIAAAPMLQRRQRRVELAPWQAELQTVETLPSRSRPDVGLVFAAEHELADSCRRKGPQQ